MIEGLAIALPVAAADVLDGRIAFAKGELRAEQGDGKYVERPPFSPIHVANSTWKQATAPNTISRAV